MFIIIAIILCFAVSFYVKDLWKQETESDAAKQTGTAVAMSTPQENKPVVRPDKYENAEFVNKHCTSLVDFIINDEINKYDLMKLADLNGIQLHIQPGWYPLTLELIKELGTLGWNKKVSCIKQKYATLRFYADYRDYKLFEKYEKRSEHICETCGERGQIRYSGWDYVACRKHYLVHRVDTHYVSKDKQATFCEICGYKAVYDGKCRCCENKTYDHLDENWKNIYEGREDYIAFEQMVWTLDEGDFYANEMGIYEKTKHHKILYTEERFNEYKNAGDE